MKHVAVVGLTVVVALFSLAGSPTRGQAGPCVGSTANGASGCPDGDENTIQANEKRIPVGHYCKRPDVPISPRETRAHHCDCTYACTVLPDGTVVETGGEHASPDNEGRGGCLSYCQKNGRTCTCHVEEPCEAGQHALADMTGQLVAVPKGR